MRVVRLFARPMRVFTPPNLKVARFIGVQADSREDELRTRQESLMPEELSHTAELSRSDAMLSYRILLLAWTALWLISYVHYRVLTGVHEHAFSGLLLKTRCQPKRSKFCPPTATFAAILRSGLSAFANTWELSTSAT